MINIIIIAILSGLLIMFLIRSIIDIITYSKYEDPVYPIAWISPAIILALLVFFCLITFK